MKRLLFLPIILLSFLSATGQSPDTLTFAGKLLFDINRIKGLPVFSHPSGSQTMALRHLSEGVQGRVPFLTLAEVRAGKADTARVIHIRDEGKSGELIYDPSDVSSADDGVFVIKITANNRRYKRPVKPYVDVFLWGIKGDGTTDETTLIQSAINNANVKTLFFPRASYRINSITVPSNKHLVFEDGSEVYGLGDTQRSSFIRMITIQNGSNISIEGKVTFRDIKASYPTGDTGQFQGCIFIEGSDNVSISGPTIKDMGGDGIQLAPGSGNTTNVNIRISNVNIDNVARNGITINTARGCWISNVSIKNVIGAAPENGIDIEPNSEFEVLYGIRLSNIYTENNKGGILIALGQYSGSNAIADIIIDNHTDDGSVNNFSVQQTSGEFFGNIVINNPTWKNSYYSGLLVYNYAAASARIDIYNPVVINANISGNSSFGFNAAYMFYRHTDAGEALLGNIHLHEPSVLDNRTPYANIRAFLFADGFTQTSNWSNVSIIDPKVIQVQSQQSYIVGLNTAPFPIVSDKYGILVKDMADSDITIRSKFGTNVTATTAYYRYLTNATSTDLRNIIFHDQIAAGTQVTVEVKSAHILRMSLTSGWTFKPLGMLNQSIQSDVIGSRITVKKTGFSDASWTITDIIGTWTDTNGNILFGKDLVGLAGYNPPTIGAGGYATTKVAVIGANIGHPAIATFNLSLNGIKPLSAYVFTSDSAMVYFENPTANPIDLGLGDVTVRVR